MSADIPRDDTNKLDAVIDALADDLQPVRPFYHPVMRMLPRFLLIAVYIIVIILAMGVRSDFIEKLGSAVFLFEILLMGCVGLSALAASAWLSVPDIRGQRWVVALPFAFLFAFGLWDVARIFEEGMPLNAIHWSHCWEIGLLVAAVPAALVVFLARGGATTHPVLMSVMNVIGFAGLPYVALRVTCNIDTVEHSTFIHMLPFVIIGVVGGLSSRYIYRW